MPKRASPSDLQAHLGYWLRLVSNAVSQSFARKVEAEGVSVAEWVFLRILFDHAPLPPSEVARRMGMTKGAISKLEGRLLEKGLIAREASLLDKRGHSLTLAPAGRALVPRLALLADVNDVDFFGGLSASERDRLESLLKKIVTSRGLTGAPID
jgi:DNA-binding MarR family transcriptional regulator